MMHITGIEVDHVMYDLVSINDKGYCCACCDFLASTDDDSADIECPIDPAICEKVIGQCAFMRRESSTTV